MATVRTASYYDPSYQAGKPAGVAMLETFWNIRSEANEAKWRARLAQLDPAALREQRYELMSERTELEKLRAEMLSGDDERRAAAIDAYNSNQVSVMQSRERVATTRITQARTHLTEERGREAESRGRRAISPQTRTGLHAGLTRSVEIEDRVSRNTAILHVVNRALTIERGALQGGSSAEKMDTVLLEAWTQLSGDREGQAALLAAFHPTGRGTVLLNQDTLEPTTEDDERARDYPINFAQEYMERYGGQSDGWLRHQAETHFLRWGVGDPDLIAPGDVPAPGQNALDSIDNAIRDVKLEIHGLRIGEAQYREEYDRLYEEGFDPLAPIRSTRWEGASMIDRVARLQQIDPERAAGQFEAAREQYQDGLSASPLIRRIERGIRSARGEEEFAMPGLFDVERGEYARERLEGVGPAGNMVDYLETETAAILGLIGSDNDDQKRQGIERAWGLNDTLSNPLVQEQMQAVGGFEDEEGNQLNVIAEFPLFMEMAQDALEDGNLTGRDGLYEIIVDALEETQFVVRGNIEDNPELRRAGYLGDTYQGAIRETIEAGEGDDYEAYSQRLSGLRHYLDALPQELRGTAGESISSEITRMEEHGDRGYMEARLGDIQESMGQYHIRPDLEVVETGSLPTTGLVVSPEDLEGIEPLGVEINRPVDLPPTSAGVVPEVTTTRTEPEPPPPPEGPPRTGAPADVEVPGVVPIPEPPEGRYTEMGEPEDIDLPVYEAPQILAPDEPIREVPLTDEEVYGQQPRGGGGPSRRPSGRSAYEIGGFEPPTDYERLPANLRPQRTARQRIIDWRQSRADVPPPEAGPAISISLPSGMDQVAVPPQSPPGEYVAQEGRDRYGGDYQEVHLRSDVDPGTIITTRWYPDKQIAHQWSQRQNRQTGAIVDMSERARASATGGDVERRKYSDLVSLVRAESR